MMQHEFEDINVALGENIKRLRRDKRWTQGELADKTGIKVGHISKLERNESDPKLETLQKLMGAFECSPNSLLNDVANTPVEGIVEMALERVMSMPERERNTLLEVIDKWCIAVSMQGLAEKNTIFGMSLFKGKTEELK